MSICPRQEVATERKNEFIWQARGVHWGSLQEDVSPESPLQPWCLPTEAVASELLVLRAGVSTGQRLSPRKLSWSGGPLCPAVVYFYNLGEDP